MIHLGSKPWFGPKDYGIGLSPKTWQGWACLFAYTILMPCTFILRDRFHASSWTVAVAALALTLALGAIVVAKSDRQRWRWRWGGK